MVETFKLIFIFMYQSYLNLFYLIKIRFIILFIHYFSFMEV